MLIFIPIGDSVEAVTPLLYRRKRLTKADIGPTDMWRIFMCLQSGLLSESTWALDVLNILLFDDTAVQWFGLSNLPGLLLLLLDHFHKSLKDMFDSARCTGRPAKPQLKAKVKAIKAEGESDAAVDAADNDNGDDDEDEDGLLKDNVDLGQVTKLPNPNDHLVVLHSTTNYTMCSRKGVPVRIKEADDDIFVLDAKRSWDSHNEVEHTANPSLASNMWLTGRTERIPYANIIDPFMGEYVNIPLARFVSPGLGKRKATDELTQKHSNNNMDSNTDNSRDSSKDTPAGDSDKTNSNSAKEVEKIDEPKIEENVTDEVAKAKSPRLRRIARGKTKSTAEKSESKAPSTGAAAEAENPSDLDSDCREVDMELDRMSNGPRSNEVADVPKEFDIRSTINDPAETMKRRRITDYEDECYARDESSLFLVSENQDTIARRCICLSNILRNLTFVPGNELILANSEAFLLVAGKILLLHHEHPIRTQTIRNYDREDDTDFSDSCSSLQGENEWWWDYLIQLRENMMVAIANIAGHMQLSNYEESVARPCLDGLLHWAICPSAHGQDPFPSCGPNSVLSPQRLALEALCKICVTDANVDLVIATPPFTRLEHLCSVLTRHLCRNEDQVLREFSVNLLHYLAAADSSMARTVAMQSPCISYLVAFIEQAEQTALGIANQHGIGYLRDNPDSMGTSLDMLRRTAGTLLHLARHPDNRTLFLQQEQRLLGLVMSHILDQQVALIISRVLFQVSRGSSHELPSPVTKMLQRHGNVKMCPPSTDSSIPVS